MTFGKIVQRKSIFHIQALENEVYNDIDTKKKNIMEKELMTNIIVHETGHFIMAAIFLEDFESLQSLELNLIPNLTKKQVFWDIRGF